MEGKEEGGSKDRWMQFKKVVRDPRRKATFFKSTWIFVWLRVWSFLTQKVRPGSWRNQSTVKMNFGGQVFFYTTRIQEVALKFCNFKSLNLLLHWFVVLLFISGAEQFLQNDSSHNATSKIVQQWIHSHGRIKHVTLFIWLQAN